MTVPPVTPAELAIHDTSPIVEGSTARESLEKSVELAQTGDQLGYRRYWAAELHGMRAVASCAPAVLAGIVASRTTRIRVGAGGVLLPYHAPLVVSEQFGTLEAMYPGRIDLALGRGAGGPTVAQTAVNGARDESVAAFSEQVDRLRAYFRHETVDRVRSVPGYGNEPQLWLLGSSAASARLAAEKRLPYVFGGHYNRNGTEDAADHYLSSADGDDGWRPHLAAWIGVIAAPSTEEAEYLAGSYRLKSTASRLWKQKRYLPSPDRAEAERPTDPEGRACFEQATAGFVIGDPDTVRRELAAFRERARVDELVIRTPVYDHSAKLRSFRIVAGA